MTSKVPRFKEAIPEVAESQWTDVIKQNRPFLFGKWQFGKKQASPSMCPFVFLWPLRGALLFKTPSHLRHRTTHPQRHRTAAASKHFTQVLEVPSPTGVSHTDLGAGIGVGLELQDRNLVF